MYRNTVTDLLAMLNPQVGQRASEYAREFQKARPFRHVVIDNFLAPDAIAQMIAQFPAEKDPSRLVNEFGVPNPKSAVSDVRGIGGVYADIDALIQTDQFLQLMSEIVGIPDLKYDPDYFGAGTHENFHGAGLDAHYDFNVLPTTRQHRRVNAIIYLNEDWKPEWGGSICFHSDPWDLDNDSIAEVQPVLNRCVIFETTESSWHSVPTVKLPASERHRSRKSFTIYLYTDTRPENEIAPSHGTVYVQEGIPKHIKAGHTLTAADEEALWVNIRRRHDYLRQMYKREYQLSHMVELLQKNLEDQKSKAYVPIIGYGKVLRVTSPPYADGWMGQRLEFTIQPLHPVKEIAFTAWRPSEDAEPMRVTLVARNRSTSGVNMGGRFQVALSFPTAVSDPFDIVLDMAGGLRPPGPSDQRELSAIIDQVELVHQFSART